MKVCEIRMEPRERNSFEAVKERIWGGGVMRGNSQMGSRAREEDSFQEGDPERFRSCPETKGNRSRNMSMVLDNGGSFSILIAISEG